MVSQTGTLDGYRYFKRRVEHGHNQYSGAGAISDATVWLAGSAVLGVLMLVIWWVSYQKPEEAQSLSVTEYEYITEGREVTGQPSPSGRLSWGQLLRYRQTWTFCLGKVFADPVWFFYLTWLPDFLMTNNQLDRKLDLKNFGIPFLVIYVVSDIGSIFFGWLATQFMKTGWPENRARKVTMLICALSVTPIS